MATWFMEGFDHYTQHTYGAGGLGTANSGAQVLRKWTAFSTLSAIASNQQTNTIDAFFAKTQPGQGFHAYSSGVVNYKTRPAGATSVIGLAANVMFESLPGNVGFMAIIDGTTEQVSVRGDGSGHLTFTRGGTVLATSTNTVSINTWYHIEMKATIHNSAGTYEVRVNGSATNWIPAATSANTRSTANNQGTGIAICGPQSGNYGYRFDDLVAWDTTGSVNVDFLGPGIIFTAHPAAAGNYAQWTPNGGSNDGNVGEIYPDDDVTFNQSSTANQIDSFALMDVPIPSGTIIAFQHVIMARQSAGAAKTIAAFQREGGVDYASATTYALSTSWLYYLDIKDVDPATSAQMTVANAKAAEFGYKLIS